MSRSDRSPHAGQGSELTSVRRWFDSYAAGEAPIEGAGQHNIDWIRAIPFVLMHLSLFSVLVVGWSPAALLVAVALYLLRMFAITGFYHRYFSHKAFKTSRTMQLVGAVMGASAVQRGPLWWAAHHRVHHATSDREGDEHSPRLHGFLWSHMGWFLSKQNFATRNKMVKDFFRYPELRFLDRFDVVVPLLLAISLYIFGEALNHYWPALATNGWQMVVWGFVISTVVLYHVTFATNSVAHSFGSRSYPVRDDSRNNALLAILTLGEGWHNNHHAYPHAARQGHRWWQIDITYYLLRLMQALGLIWDIRDVPQRLLDQRGHDRLGAVQ